MSPRIQEIFLSRIEEVQSPLLNAARDWSFFLYGYVYSAVGLVACVLATFLVERRKRVATAMVSAVAAMSFAVMSIEVRGILFAVLLSLPGLATAVQLLIERWTRPGWRAALATIGALIVFANVSFVYAGNAVRQLIETAPTSSQRERADQESRYCYSESSVGQLASLPRGLVVAFLDQGPSILAYSKHSVVGGPYHRNERGILDTFDLLTKEPGVGARIARQRGINYVVICRTSYDYNYYLSAGGQMGLLSRLASNRAPAWLSPVRSGGANSNVRIYKVLSDRLRPSR